jgi:hypothetical protein
VRGVSEELLSGGLIDLVEVREGDVLQTLRVDLPETIDLVLLDGAKGLYPEILALLEGRLRPGAFIVADNADHSPDYLARVRSPPAAISRCRSAMTSSCRCGPSEATSRPMHERCAVPMRGRLANTSDCCPRFPRNRITAA